MASILKVDTIQDTSGNNIINENADTITIGASGDTINVVGTLQNNGSGLIQGITEADQWRIASNFNYSGSQSLSLLSSNWERVDTNGFGLLGTGMTESSGVFTFPSTGIYLVTFTAHAEGSNTNNNRFVLGATEITTDGTNFTQASEVATNILGNTNNDDTRGTFFCVHQFDVTNVATHKVRFTVACNNNNVIFFGSTSVSLTCVNFIRLGDT